jgi:hypothetical protein
MTRRLFFISLAMAAAVWAAAGFTQTGAPAAKTSVTREEARPLTPEEIRALAARAIANQHRDDEAADAFEHIDHLFDRAGASDLRVSQNKTFRVVPTGTGTLKLLLKENDRPVSAQEYQRQLKIWAQILEVAIQPGDPRQKASLEKCRKRRKERADLVDAALDAYRFGWLGRETRNGRAVTKLSLDPNPQFQPRTRAADMLTHARATIWVDDESGQMMHAEADITRDISFGGGILGKVYRGGHFEMDQAEVALGIWLPTRYKYDFSGRKFLFVFEVHELTEISHYHRLGTPGEALTAARRELQTDPTSAAGDP